jgi:predicted PolB exonuclease-like 3'-5' exonuclease
MLNESFNRLVVFDIETVSEYESYQQLLSENPKKAELWGRRCVWLRSRYAENAKLDDDSLYLAKAALQPEFSKIVCISIGQIKNDGASITVKSYSGEERDILSEFIKVNAAVMSKIPGAQYCGHNIKRFDVPFIAKRILINGLKLPQNFQVFRMKSWELPFLDTSEIWSFGAWQESYTALDLLSNVLDIPTPKDEMCGSEVGKAYYSGNIDNIIEYCEKDVIAVCQILLRLSNIEIDADIQRR